MEDILNGEIVIEEVVFVVENELVRRRANV